MTGWSLLAYASGLPAFLAIKVLAPAFFARQDTKTPVRIGIVALISNMLYNVLLVRADGHDGLRRPAHRTRARDQPVRLAAGRSRSTARLARRGIYRLSPALLRFAARTLPSLVALAAVLLRRAAARLARSRRRRPGPRSSSVQSCSPLRLGARAAARRRPPARAGQSTTRLTSPRRMRLIRRLAGWPAEPEGCVATIGNFDGVHLGHQRMLAAVRTRADDLGLPATTVSFEPLPHEYFAAAKAPGRLQGLRDRARLAAGERCRAAAAAAVRTRARRSGSRRLRRPKCWSARSAYATW